MRKSFTSLYFSLLTFLQVLSFCMSSKDQEEGFESLFNGTAAGKDHQGLKSSSGHIGFLGHDDMVRFRNIEIKELTVTTK